MNIIEIVIRVPITTCAGGDDNLSGRVIGTEVLKLVDVGLAIIGAIHVDVRHPRLVPHRRVQLITDTMVSGIGDYASRVGANRSIDVDAGWNIQQENPVLRSFGGIGGQPV